MPREGLGERSRETLLELEDRKGVHETEFGHVQIDVIIVPTCSGPNMDIFPLAYYRKLTHNTDIIIDASNAPDLRARLGASKRRISVGRNGRGAQQIGKDTTLFVHSDLFRQELR